MLKNYAFATYLFLTLSGATAQTTNQHLIAEYLFNGNSLDSGRHRLNGTVRNAELTSDRFENNFSAYYFNGKDASIEVADDSLLRLSNTDFSISLWVNQYEYTYKNSMIVSKRDTGSKKGWYLAILGQQAEPTFPAKTFAFHLSGGPDQDIIYSKTLFATHTWYHVVVTYNKTTKNARMYVNGELETEKNNFSMPDSLTKAPLFIGRDNPVNPLTGYFLHGKIDDLRIYGQELDSKNISQLFTEKKYDTDSLIAYYPFNENALDSTRHHFDGSVNNANLTTDRFGNENSAYLFNGYSSYIEVKDSKELRLADTDYSIAAWVNKYDYAYNNNMIISKRGPGSQNGYYLGILGTQAEPTFPARSFAYHLSGGGDKSIIWSQTSFVIDSWYHVVFTYNNLLHTGRLYVNGKLESTNSNLPSPNSFTDVPLQIGHDNPELSASGYFFNGKIDDVKIYKRTLSSNDVNKLYTPEIITSVSQTAAAQISVWENPNEKGSLEISSSEPIDEINVFNLTGDLIYKSSSFTDVPQSYQKVQISKIPGLYIAKIRTETGSYVKKVKVGN